MSNLDERIAALSPEQRELLLQRIKNRGTSSIDRDGVTKQKSALHDSTIGLVTPAALAAPETIQADDAALPAHLVKLPGGAWMLWRLVTLRGAGFPVELVLKLAPPLCSTAAQRLLEAESHAQLAEDAAAAAVNAELDALRRDDLWHDAPRRNLLVKLLRGIRQHKLSTSGSYSRAIGEAVTVFQVTLRQVDEAQASYRAAFEASVREISQVIHTVACDERFREAVIWQNRQAYHTGVLPLCSSREKSRNSRQRQHEELVASYLQRYCAKNDTIGFFGPVGWAHFRSAGDPVTIRAGAALLAERSVYFEGWAIDALGDVLAQNEALLPWGAPRLMPFLYLEGNALHMPLTPPTQLSPQHTVVLQACDGQRTARQIARDLIQVSAAGLQSEPEVYQLLRELRAQRRIAWTLEVLAEDLHPERHLRARLEQVEDEALRGSALQMLEELEQARADVIQAAGDARALDQAQEQLESTFTRLTRQEATRRAGQMYASRTLVYEDCRRDITLDFGPDLLTTLGPPLSLLMTSARWFTYQVANAYRQAFERTFRTLSRKAGSAVVDFADFWLYVQPFVLGDDTRIVDALQKVFQERWTALLSPPLDSGPLTYSVEDLRDKVLAAFDAPYPGWQSARYHSPDLMINAIDVTAIRRGEYQIVMGEFHLAMNTTKINLFMSQHPQPQEITQALEHDLPHPVIVPVVSKQWPAPPPRTLATVTSAKDFRLIYAHDSCAIPPEQALPIGGLVIRETQHGLQVSTRDGRLHFDIIELFGELLTFRVADSMKLVPRTKHTPSISFDRLIVCRETWHFSPDEITFVHESVEAERFVAARRWRQAHGIPRFVFMKSSVEEKPIYTDFDSPLLLDLFSKIVRRTLEQGGPEATVRMTEMLPDPNHIWLPDQHDQRYTSELRIVGVDSALTPQRYW